MINRLKTIEYHFVHNESLKKKLTAVSNCLKLRLSKTVVFIIENISPLFSKMHLIYKEENNLVENVNWNCHLPVYINNGREELYNKLKSINKDNITYSMAMKLRYILKIFIRGVERYGFYEFLKNLKKKEKNGELKKVW